MIKKFTLLVMAAIMALPYCSAQTYRKLEGVILNNLSNNGKWAMGNIGNNGMYIYDYENDKTSVIEGFYWGAAISNTGVVAGSREMNAPCYFVNEECIELPSPTDDPNYVSCSAMGISEDNTMICGTTTYKYEDRKGSLRKPCLWTLQGDGSYKYEELEYQDLDYTKLPIQGTDALFCSENIIVGRLIDYSGWRNLPVTWRKDENGKWKFQLEGVNFVYKEGAEIPVMPVAPEQVNAMEYFSEEDSLRYEEDLVKYENGEITDNPLYHQKDYISDPDSLAAYNEAYEQYKLDLQEYQKQMGEYNKQLAAAMTGYTFELFACTWNKDKYLVLSTNTSDEFGNTISSPAYLDLQTGEVHSFNAQQGLTCSITSDKTLFYGVPYDNPTRTTFLLENGEGEPKEFVAWVREKTGGVIDIEDDYRFDFTYYIDRVPYEAVDSLVVGNVLASNDGNMMMSFMPHPETGAYNVFFIQLKDDASVNDGKVQEAYADGNVLYLPENTESVEIFDVCGKMVYKAAATDRSMDLSQFAKGVYVVRISAGGDISTAKIYIE